MTSARHDWTSADFRAALAAMVRRRVPADDVEDVVQAALTEAVASQHRPTDPEEARRWIWGVARHKIADYHRRAGREVHDLPELVAPPTPEAERDLLRWASSVMPAGEEAQRTFAWLLREGEGESLEDIASAERLPPPQVRQRVSRLRKLFRTHWAAQLAAAGLLVLLVFLARRMRRPEVPPVARRPAPVLQESPEVMAARARGRVLREAAVQQCAQRDWRRCLDGLDTARSLDPTGDNTDRVRVLRERAREALERERIVPPTPSPSPTGDVPPTGDGPPLAPPRRRPRPRVPRLSDYHGGSAS